MTPSVFILIAVSVVALITALFMWIQKEILNRRSSKEIRNARDAGFDEGLASARAEMRFGLSEAAKAASYYAKDKVRDSAVLAVVCGVFGLKNEVSSDAEKEIRELYECAKAGTAKIEEIGKQIAALQAKIVSVSEAIAKYDRRAAEAQEIAERFGDLASDLAVSGGTSEAPEKPAEPSVVDEEP